MKKRLAAAILIWFVAWVAIGAAYPSLGLIVFFGGLVGLVVWIVVRKRRGGVAKARGSRSLGNPFKAAGGLFRSEPDPPEIIAARAKLAEVEARYKKETSAAKAASKLADAAYKGQKVANFKGNKLTTTMLNDKPVHGARATVDANGTAYTNSRLSATRIVTLGVFSLAAPKRKTIDNRELYLNIITGDGEVRAIKCDPKLESDRARQFAAKVSTLGAQAPTPEQVKALLDASLVAKKAVSEAEANTAEREAAKIELDRLVAENKAAKAAQNAS